MLLTLLNFGGEVPRFDPQLLPDNAATVAENVRLLARRLESWKRPKFIASPAKAGNLVSLYRMYSGATDYWLSWTDDVDAVKGPIATDTDFKLYYTGDSTGTGGPKKTNLTLATAASDYPNDYLEMGVPAPSVMVWVNLSPAGTAPTATRSFVMTGVTTWGEESAPSPPVTQTQNANGTWNFTLPALSGGKYSWQYKRIYRTVTDAAGVTRYFRIGEVGTGVTSFADNGAANTDAVISTNTILPTYTLGLVGSEWVPPPSDLKSLCGGLNGVMAGISVSKKSVCFCEPYAPWAWPTLYQYALPHEPVAVASIGRSWVVMTKAMPYLFTGAHPRLMEQDPIRRHDMPCISKRSVAVFSFGVAFATPNGMALIGESGEARMVTEEFMTRDEWQAKCYPATIRGRAWQDRYVGFFDTGVGLKGFLFDRANDQGPLTFMNEAVTGAYVDPENSKLYLVQNNDVMEWDADTSNRMVYAWESKEFVLPEPKNMAAAQVDASYADLDGDFADAVASEAARDAVNADIIANVTDDYANQTASRFMGDLGGHIFGGYWEWVDADPDTRGYGGNNYGIPFGGNLLLDDYWPSYVSRYVSFKLYVKNSDTDQWELKHTEIPTKVEPFRLPSGYLEDRVKIGVDGNIPVSRVRVATSMTDLKAN